MKSQFKNVGSSLIEVLSCTAIILIIASLLTGSIITVRERGKQAICINNLKNLTNSIILSALDFERYPIDIALMGTDSPSPPQDYAFAGLSLYYDNQMKINNCPKASGSILDTTPYYSYGINQLIRNVVISKVKQPSQIIIAGESAGRSVLGITDQVGYRHINGTYMGFADGHVERVRSSELVNALANYYESSPSDPTGFGILRVPGPFITIGDAPFDFANDHVCSNGFRWDYMGLTDNGNGTSTFSFKLTNNNNHNLIYTSFELPAGKSAVSPADGSTYVGPTDTYNVDNTAEIPFHSIKFHKTGQAIKNGESDVFAFTLNNSDISLIQTMRVQSKASSITGQGTFDTQPTPDTC